MKRVSILAGLFFFMVTAYSYADRSFGFGSDAIKGVTLPGRTSLSDVNYSNYKSSAIVGSKTCNPTQLATGTIRLDSMFVSSPGTNSAMWLYDSNISTTQAFTGNSTMSLTAQGGVPTGTYGEIPFRIKTSTQGLVYVSTCASCYLPWIAPRVRFIFERVR